MTFNYLEQVCHVSPFTIVTTFVVLFLGILYIVLKNKNLPPGPVGLPLVGYWPFLQDETVHLQLQEMTKKYGDVFSFTVAGKLFIHLGSIKSIKEAHITKSDVFSQRSTDYSVLLITFGRGISTVNGEEWKVLRKFFKQAFREYGMVSVKDYMAGSIHDSVNTTIESLKATDRSPVNIISLFNLSCIGILRRMLFNDGNITNEEIRGILDVYGTLLNLIIGKKALLIGEFARKYLFPRIKSYEDSLKSHKIIYDYLKKNVERHKETFDKDNIRDIIDSYIKEKRDRISKGDPTSEYFSDDALIGSLIQFIGDGILSVAIFTAYFIHALLEYPEEQEKIHKELIDVVGTDRDVTLEDKSKLPYTHAFMQEVIRTTDSFTHIASLECTKETTLNGYRIPVGAITLTNYWAAHRDPAVYEDSDAFKPSRFVTEPGKPKPETPILFGAGKRSCAGEAFTMMQVFLFVTAIVKNFRLERPKGEVKKSFLDGRMDVIASPRNKN